MYSYSIQESSSCEIKGSIASSSGDIYNIQKLADSGSVSKLSANYLSASWVKKVDSLYIIIKLLGLSADETKVYVVDQDTVGTYIYVYATSDGSLIKKIEA